MPKINLIKWEPRMNPEERAQLRIALVAVHVSLLIYKSKTPPTTKAQAAKIVAQAEVIADMVLATYGK